MSIDNKDLFNAINGMMDRLMAEMGEDSASFQPHVVGFRIVIDSVPVAPGMSGPAATGGTEQPAPEVHRIGDEVYVVAGLPGVSEENLNLNLDGETLVIESSSNIGTCHTTAVLPPVDAATMKHSLKNGVLEVTFRALPEATDTDTSSEPETTS
ncbi:MAG: Hsp20/alpha crystallin family protein [Methanoregula sp.]|jgi:HSP20 family molecular chaperone IbpA|uniref:Hsp20/alpha crystallin family protein n=1 Tax=Methanoregula sp. TaxID=2052170 RepID=UPI003C27A504